MSPTWSSGPTQQFPALPYPGMRPNHSWRLVDGNVHRLALTRRGWVDQVSGDAVGLDGRHLILGYGSNLNPTKLARHFDDDVAVVTVTVLDWAAAWCDARRGDGCVVATLVPMPGAVETHAVVAVTSQQRAVMDRFEGHPTYYRRQRFTGRCVLDNGQEVRPEVYLGTTAMRPALLRAGRPLLLREVPYGEVDRLVAVRQS